MPKLIDHKVYYNQNELESVISRSTFEMARAHNSTAFEFLENANRSVGESKWLVQYDCLSQERKVAIKNQLHNGVEPLDVIRMETFKEGLKLKDEDAQLIDSFLTPQGKFLDTKVKTNYKECCRVLNMLGGLTANKLKRLGFAKNAKGFYNLIISYVITQDLSLPRVYCKLMEKRRAYEKEGANAVISKHYGNQYVRKVDKIGETVIKKLWSLHHHLDYEDIKNLYNTEIQKYNLKQKAKLKPICRQTVANYICKFELEAARSGEAIWRNNNDFVVSRQRPSAPNQLWVGDGWKFEAYYQKTTTNSEGRTNTDFWYSKLVYIVIDAFNDTIVGYSIADTENIEVTKSAWTHACKSQGVLPHQIKCDHFAKATLFPFYESLCRNKDYFTPPQKGNARDKVIESMFGRWNKKIVKCLPSWSGFGVKSIHQPSREYLNSIRHNFPDEEILIQQIEWAINAWNARIEKGKTVSRIHEYQNGNHSEDRILTTEKRLELFGELSEFNTLTNKGLCPTILGKKRIYMDFDNANFYINNVNTTRYHVHYDRDDLSKVLAISEDGRQRWILGEVQNSKMSLMDMQQGDKTHLNKVLTFKKEMEKEVLGRQAQREKVLEEVGIHIDSASIIKQMPITKGHQKEQLAHAESELKRLSLPEVKTIKKLVIEEDQDTWKGLDYSQVYEHRKKQKASL